MLLEIPVLGKAPRTEFANKRMLSRMSSHMVEEIPSLVEDAPAPLSCAFEQFPLPRRIKVRKQIWRRMMRLPSGCA